MNLLDKIKIFELAKKLDLSSKEILEIAAKLNITAKSHMSSIQPEEADKIEKHVKKGKPAATHGTKKKEEKQPVIIRREVIISDEEIARSYYFS